MTDTSLKPVTKQRSNVAAAVIISVAFLMVTSTPSSW